MNLKIKCALALLLTVYFTVCITPGSARPSQDKSSILEALAGKIQQGELPGLRSDEQDEEIEMQGQEPGQAFEKSDGKLFYIHKINKDALLVVLIRPCMHADS